MVKRSPISKLLRFEVFKRDAFTCRYCGRTSPEVILELDHIDPVKNGGGNSMLNLITSCRDCNRGKGVRVLSDTQMLDKQREQLNDLNERREQMKQMLAWKKELDHLSEEQIDAMNDLLKYKKMTLSESGVIRFKKWIKEFGFSEVFESFQISLEQYMDAGDISKVVPYVPRICETRKQTAINPVYSKRNYLRKMITNNYRTYTTDRIERIVHELCQTIEIADQLITIVKCSRMSDDFFRNVNERFEGKW